MRDLRSQRDSLDDAIFISEQMLGRWPNDPQIVSAAVNLHFRYVGILAKRGSVARSMKENERLLSILEILFYNPENSDSVKEELIRLQLNRLNMSRSRLSKDEQDALRRKIERELQYYHGPKLEEFRSDLNKIGEDDTGKKSPGKSSDRPAGRHFNPGRTGPGAAPSGDSAGQPPFRPRRPSVRNSDRQ